MNYRLVWVHRITLNHYDSVSKEFNTIEDAAYWASLVLGNIDAVLFNNAVHNNDGIVRIKIGNRWINPVTDIK